MLTLYELKKKTTKIYFEGGPTVSAALKPYMGKTVLRCTPIATKIQALAQEIKTKGPYRFRDVADALNRVADSGRITGWFDAINNRRGSTMGYGRYGYADLSGVKATVLETLQDKADPRAGAWRLEAASLINDMLGILAAASKVYEDHIAYYYALHRELKEVGKERRVFARYAEGQWFAIRLLEEDASERVFFYQE